MRGLQRFVCEASFDDRPDLVQWQATHGVNNYEPISGYEHNNVDDVMQPFDDADVKARPVDVADIAVLGYTDDDSLNVASASVAPSQPEVATSAVAGSPASTGILLQTHRLA